MCNDKDYKELLDIVLKKAKPNTPGNILAPPTDAQKAIDLLIEFFLGKDWYVNYPCNSEQVNTEALMSIMSHPNTRKFRKRFLKTHRQK